MTEPPPVNWGALIPRLRGGDQVCITHGRLPAVVASIGIPTCPRCRQALHTVRIDRTGRLTGFDEPTPPRCAGPEQHPLGPGTVLLGWARVHV